jgi:hydrogenase/urease accessory protein HupE
MNQHTRHDIASILMIFGFFVSASAQAHPAGPSDPGVLQGLEHGFSGLDHWATIIVGVLVSVRLSKISRAVRATGVFLLVVLGAVSAILWTADVPSLNYLAVGVFMLSLFSAALWRRGYVAPAMLAASLFWLHGFFHFRPLIEDQLPISFLLGVGVSFALMYLLTDWGHSLVFKKHGKSDALVQKPN